MIISILVVTIQVFSMELEYMWKYMCMYVSVFLESPQMSDRGFSHIQMNFILNKFGRDWIQFIFSFIVCEKSQLVLKMSTQKSQENSKALFFNNENAFIVMFLLASSLHRVLKMCSSCTFGTRIVSRFKHAHLVVCRQCCFEKKKVT